MDLVKIGLVDHGLGGRYFHVPLIAAADVLGAARSDRTAYDGSSRSRAVIGRELLDELAAQESRLVFDRFERTPPGHWESPCGRPHSPLPFRLRSRSVATASACSTLRFRARQRTTTVGSDARAPWSTAMAAPRSA